MIENLVIISVGIGFCLLLFANAQEKAIRKKWADWAEGHFDSNEILKAYLELQNNPSVAGSLKQFRRMCLNNPESIISIAFDEKINMDIRTDILMGRSRDHSGSIAEADNPRWYAMLRKGVVPNVAQLPDEIHEQIDWYQQVHGL